MNIDRKNPPQIKDAIDFDFKLPGINTDALDNGIPLYWLNAGVQDVVEIDWVFPAGLWQEEKTSVSQATASLIKNGTSKRTAEEITEALEYYGATFRARPGNDYTIFSLFTLTKHLPDVLPVIFEIFTDAVFPEKEVEIYKQNVTQRLMVNLRRCDFVANREIDAILFGYEHPYGRYTRIEDIEQLTREDLLQEYKTHYNLSDVQIFMAGNVGEKETQWLNEVFGKFDLNKKEIKDAEKTPHTNTEKKHHIINDKDGVQGAIRIGSLFPTRHHPDFAPMVVLNTLFGGYFGSRLMSNIREDKGYTYGIYSAISPYKHNGSLVIQTEVGRDVIENAVKEIYFEMDKLCNEAADKEEVLLVKNYLLGSLLGDLDGPFHILQRWRTIILNGQNAEDFNKNVQVYKTVDAATLQNMAQKYFTKEQFHEAVVI